MKNNLTLKGEMPIYICSKFFTRYLFWGLRMLKEKNFAGLAQKIKELEHKLKSYNQTEKRFHASEKIFNAFADTSSDMIHINDRDGRIRFANKATEELLGYPLEDILERSALDLIHPDDRDLIHQDLADIFHLKGIPTREIQLIRSDGTFLDVEVSGFMVSLDEGEPYVGAIIRDISLRKQTDTKLKEYQNLLEKEVIKRTDDLISTNEHLRHEISERILIEEKLRESEERYRDLFEHATDLIQIVRPDGSFDFVNRSWLDTFGYTSAEAKNLSIFDVIHPECKDHCANMFHQVMKDGRADKIEAVFITKDGRKIVTEGSANCKIVDGKPVYTRCIFRDVTEKKRMEKELLNAQKLESIADLAGGIAHDFNNLLTGILGNISLAMMGLDGADKTYKILATAEDATLRASSLTKKLITFSHGGAPIKEEADLAEVVTDAANFALTGTNIKTDLSVARDLWMVEIDKEQMHHVINNMVSNAKDAMPLGGTISITLENISVMPTDRQELKEGKYVSVTIKDTGDGIAEEYLPRIFDPYFTSKQMNDSKGTGLGLAVCYSIIKKHKGNIAVNSSAGGGTAFTIYLPAIPAVQQELPTETNQTDSPASQKQKILVMDDENVIRDIASQTLDHFGYAVQCAKDGDEAVEIFLKATESGQPFNIALLDLTIPGEEGGKDVVRRLLDIDPGVRAIVTSGYSNDPVMQNFTEYGFSGAIAKPFTLDELNRVLKETS